MTVPLPPDENSRLQALAPYRSLGLATEESFDRITSLAARIFRVPIALITLLDSDRQFFKSHHGTDLCESSRESAFCTYAILPPGDVFVVPDATLDPRFAGNPLVTGPAGIRFYAGAALRTSGGQALGTLCVIDTAPRADLSADERALLTDLAAMAMETFDLRLARRQTEEEAAERHWIEEALRRSEGRLRRIAANAPA